MTQINTSNNGQMSVMEAIQSRRTIFKFKPDPVPKNILEDLLYAGIWAPNHHLTEPWRFTVIGEEVKLKLAERYGAIQIEKVTSNPEAAKAATEEVSLKLQNAGSRSSCRNRQSSQFPVSKKGATNAGEKIMRPCAVQCSTFNSLVGNRASVCSGALAGSRWNKELTIYSVSIQKLSIL